MLGGVNIPVFCCTTHSIEMIDLYREYTELGCDATAGITRVSLWIWIRGKILQFKIVKKGCGVSETVNFLFILR